MLMDFFVNADKRPEIFGERALNMKSFATFVDILHSSTSKLSHLELGRALCKGLKVEWKDGTAKTNAKIMLDWARHTNLAPEIYSSLRRKKEQRSKDSPTLPGL